MDLIIVLLVCLPLGMICEKLCLPTLFGYVMTGVLLGPSGVNCLKSMVGIKMRVSTSDDHYKLRFKLKQLASSAFSSFYSSPDSNSHRIKSAKSGESQSKAQP